MTKIYKNADRSLKWIPESPTVELDSELNTIRNWRDSGQRLAELEKVPMK